MAALRLTGTQADWPAGGPGGAAHSGWKAAAVRVSGWLRPGPRPGRVSCQLSAPCGLVSRDHPGTCGRIVSEYSAAHWQ
jgi:hypothetical protein